MKAEMDISSWSLLTVVSVQNLLPRTDEELFKALQNFKGNYSKLQEEPSGWHPAHVIKSQFAASGRSTSEGVARVVHTTFARSKTLVSRRTYR